MVLQEILKWSAYRPAWQRDALRRLVLNGALVDEDISALAEICKSGHGLADAARSQPLSREHVPDGAASRAAVALHSIFHRRGVNALAEGQRLRFAPGLTVVYGDNGAGKTGYTRILKRACRARGREDILGNVVAGTAPPKPDVAITYRIGNAPDSAEWIGEGVDEHLPRVSVFDTQCAAVYLKDKTNVAFLPFGLDLFDKLVKACRAVAQKLELEQRALNTNVLAPILGQVPDGTTAARLLASITSLTRPEAIYAVTRLSDAEEKRRALLEKALQDLQANDPEKLIRQLTLQAGRVRALAEHLASTEATLSDAEVKALLTARSDGRNKSEQARRLRDATFPARVLPGTGNDQWKDFWEAARQFSEQGAFPGRAFPVVDDDASCVLCQQGFDHAAAHRLRNFETFVTSTTEQELRALREEFVRRRTALQALRVTTEATTGTIRELRLEHEAASTAVAAAQALNESRRGAVLKALAENHDVAADCPAVAVASQAVGTVVVEIDARIAALRKTGSPEDKRRMTVEFTELQSRKQLAKHEALLLDEITRKARIAAYGQCLEETKPTAITQKGSAVTKAVVSERLKKGFRDELKKLGFSHVEVELREAGGSEGVFYHKLVLTRNPGIEVPKVVSEGEQRCISIAAFFAELSTADDPSGIVFDDPVSSLDFQWRNGVAKRLVEESKRRQVIVFTHDVVFLLAIRQLAELGGIEVLDQHVRRQAHGAGVCAEELPWVAMRVRDKIGYIKKMWQEIDKLSREGKQDEYEYGAKYLYGLLREAWERALEEVLLAGVVERYRPSVESQRLGPLTDITDADCQTVDAAMTQCSTWLPGHDQAAAARAPVPGPAELKVDIDQLESWIKGIRDRRK